MVMYTTETCHNVEKKNKLTEIWRSYSSRRSATTTTSCCYANNRISCG